MPLLRENAIRKIFIAGAEWADANPGPIFLKALEERKFSSIYCKQDDALTEQVKQLQSEKTILVEALKKACACNTVPLSSEACIALEKIKL
jgi:hypothetical protein